LGNKLIMMMKSGQPGTTVEFNDAQKTQTPGYQGTGSHGNCPHGE
jgi:hypothetical protein